MDVKIKSAIQTIATEKSRNGWKNNKIIAHIENLFPNISPTTINEICRNARKNIQTSHSLEKDFTVGLHLTRYSEFIQDLLDGLDQLVDDDSENSYKFFVINFENCLKTLYQKERIIGFHSKKFKVIIHNIYKKVEVTRKNKVHFSIEKLNFDEQIELNNLLEKAKNKI